MSAVHHDAGLALALSIGGHGAAVAAPASATRSSSSSSSGDKEERPSAADEPSLTLGLRDCAMSPARISAGERQDDQEVERASSGTRASEEEDEVGGSSSAMAARKKLTLTKAQSSVLEDRFREHSTLNNKQKLALAKQLNLRPRQVEVWFQNKRARMKLKQTEVDCEFLKRCCETLKEENRRLKLELQELKALQPFGSTPPAATLTMCQSCQLRGNTAGGADFAAAAAAARLASKKALFFSTSSSSSPRSTAC